MNETLKFWIVEDNVEMHELENWTTWFVVLNHYLPVDV